MDFDKAYKLVVGKLTKWAEDIVRLLPNILLAALILVVGLYLVKVIKNFIAKFLKKGIHNETLAEFIISFLHVALILIVSFIALNILNLDKTVTTLLAGAGIIGLALAFAFQDIATNFMSGIFLSLRRPIHVGDTVKIKGYMGKIAEIRLRDTVVRTFQGQMVIIPNKEVFQNPIENFSILGKRRVDVTLGVSYGDDLERAKQIALEASNTVANISKDDPVTIYYTDFGDSSINFIVRIWINIAEADINQVKSDAIVAIKKAFDGNDIMIPFPITTLDFGVKGGKNLDELNILKRETETAD